MPPEVRRWLFILRVPLALLGVFLFFALYNRFLLDSNLRNLRTSFSILDSASGIGQAEAALLLVDQTLTAQMAEEDLNLRAASALQYAQGALASDKMDRPLDDAQAMLNILEEEQGSERPGILLALDGFVLSAQEVFHQAALLPRQALGKPLSPEIDTARLEEAVRLERKGQLKEATTLYEELLKTYPNYTGRGSLKLRMGLLFQKSNDFKQARRLYQEALAEIRDARESTVARQMLQNLAQLRGRADQAKGLQRNLARAEPGESQQRAAFKLGSTLIRASSFDEAAKAFRKSFLADPEGEPAVPSLFKEAWCLRAAGRTEEAFSRFSGLLKAHPGTDWAVAAQLQIAEMYKASGNLAAAGEAYERATSMKTADSALTAIAYAQAGCTYQFDLNDVGKAQVLLRDLANKFPASSYSTVGRQLEQLQAKKGRLPASTGPGIAAPGGPAPLPPEPAPGGMFAAGSPLVNWLENFLPVFVSVFSERLSKYMEAVGEKQLSRRFTDVEFGELVVREVQRKFPGQVTHVKTQIHPDGFVGSGDVHLGILNFRVEAKLGIVIRNDRPYAIVQSIKIGNFSLPEPLLKLLETRVNTTIDRTKYSLKVKEYKLNEGYAWISVEVAD